MLHYFARIFFAESDGLWPLDKLNIHKHMKRCAYWMLAALTLWWIMLLCSCATPGRATHQNQNNGGVKPAQQQKIITSIPVDQIDLNGDGQISQSEQQTLQPHDNHALLTFLCISGATIIMCVAGAWVTCRNRHNKSSESLSTVSPSYGPDKRGSADGDLRPETVESVDQWPQVGDTWSQQPVQTTPGDWLDSEQNFQQDPGADNPRP